MWLLVCFLHTFVFFLALRSLNLVTSSACADIIISFTILARARPLMGASRPPACMTIRLY